MSGRHQHAAHAAEHPVPAPHGAERGRDVERGVLDFVVDHVVQRLQVLQLGLDAVHPPHQLAPDPPGRLGEGPGLVPHQHHQILALFGQAAHRLERLRRRRPAGRPPGR